MPLIKSGMAPVFNAVPSNLHPLKLDLALDVAGEVGLDVVEVGDLVDVCRGSDEVGALDEFEARFLEADAG